MLFIKLTGGPFLQGQSFLNLQSFWFLERTSDFQTASAGVCWTGQIFVVTRDGPNEAEGLGRLSALTGKTRFILVYNSQPKFRQTFGTCLHKYVTKLPRNEKGISVCLKRKPFQIRFRESVFCIYELTICSVLRVITLTLVNASGECKTPQMGSNKWRWSSAELRPISSH